MRWGGVLGERGALGRSLGGTWCVGAEFGNVTFCCKSRVPSCATHGLNRCGGMTGIFWFGWFAKRAMLIKRRKAPRFWVRGSRGPTGKVDGGVLLLVFRHGGASSPFLFSQINAKAKRAPERAPCTDLSGTFHNCSPQLSRHRSRLGNLVFQILCGSLLHPQRVN